MQVNSVNYDLTNHNINKKSKVSKQNFKSDETTTEVAELKNELEKSKKSRKWGVGIASACLTGLGQIINGEVGKGLAFLFGSIVAGGVSLLTLKVNKSLGAILTIASLGLPIWSIVDAVKGVDRK